MLVNIAAYRQSLNVTFFSAAISFMLLVFAAKLGHTDEPVDILRKHCAPCHNQKGDYDGDFLYVLDVQKLIANRKVVPGAISKSEIIGRIVDGSMPPPGKERSGRVTDAELNILQRWVETLSTVAEERANISLLKEFQAMDDYLNSQSREKQERTRFFSLRHVHNNPGIGGPDLEMIRLAFAKAINSLSWQKQLTEIAKVDQESTLYAVDLATTSWGRKGWQQILSVYPYGLRYDTSIDENLSRVSREVYRKAKSTLPVVRMDWFVAAGMRPPLYHQLLELPVSEAELEAKIGIRSKDNIAQGLVSRTGSKQSGVSSQNRLIERHGNGKFGYYWKSYDFKPESESRRSDLLAFPLGPLNARLGFEDLEFRHDGGELIFQLPNGLQGYFLVDGKGRRIDSGPQDVVEDSAGRFSGSSLVLNGVSCAGCHASGLRPAKSDDVLVGSSVRGEALATLRRLHPGDAKIGELIAQDSQSFTQAATKAMQNISKSRTINDPGSSDTVLEPIGGVAKTFVDRPLALAEVAAELDLPPDRLSVVISANAEAKKLGLAPLANGQVLRRRFLEENRGIATRFQRIAEILEIGTPVQTIISE